MIAIQLSGLTCKTDGLSKTLGYEISATVDNPSLIKGCEQFVKFVLAYILDGHLINSGETIGYGYWITKAIANGGDLEFWEYNADATDYIFGVSNTLQYWQEQHQICEKISSMFIPPRADQMIVISDGVYEGEIVQGVRYQSPKHMSGWWITTDRYDGDVNSLKTVHAYHLTEKRPDLAKFLALSAGHRFYSDSGEVKFDQKLLGNDNGNEE